MAAAAAAMLIVSGILLVRTMGGGSDAGTASRRRDVIDAETGELFRDFPIAEGARFPWTNPKTGTPTLYPAERCYWTRDGRATLEPTFVFVKEYADIDEDTTCPDCGREVVPHNPLPPEELMIEAARARGARDPGGRDPGGRDRGGRDPGGGDPGSRDPG